MLEETADELPGCQGQGMPLLIFTALVFESDLSLLVFKDAVGTQRRAIDVGGEILQRRFSAACCLHIDDPLLPPDPGWNLRRVGLALHRGVEPIAETISQYPMGQEEVRGLWAAPTQPV